MFSRTEPTLIKNGDNCLGRELNIFRDRIRVKVAGTDTNDRFALFEGVIEPQVGPPLHVHHREDECFHVLEGTFRFEANGQQTILTAGDTMFMPRGVPHTFQNAGDRVGRVLTLVEPAGLERFFQELADATAGTDHPELSVVLPIFEKYGLEMLGPPMAARTQAAGA